MEDLEKRITALEKSAKHEADKDAIRKREMEFLQTLREIRAAIVKEQTEQGAAGASSDEVETLKMENARLQQVVTKQAYRIQHLVSGFEALMNEKKE